VHPNRPFAKTQRDSFYQQLLLGEDRIAGVARFAVAWSTPGRSNALTRQATGLEFAPDEQAKRFVRHEGEYEVFTSSSQASEIANIFRKLLYARPRPEKKRDEKTAQQAEQLDPADAVGDRLVDETGEYEVIYRPHTTNAGEGRARQAGQPAGRHRDPDLARARARRDETWEEDG